MSDQIQARLALTHHNSYRAQEIASALIAFGFQIHWIAARGVSFSGSQALFEQTFQTSVQNTNGRLSFEHSPVIPPNLMNADPIVYLPTRIEIHA